MRSFFNVDSTVTTGWLVEVRKNYFIPPEHELHVPLSGERPYNAFSCGFGLSTDALEAGLRFLLHPVIEACLDNKGWKSHFFFISYRQGWIFPIESTSRMERVAPIAGDVRVSVVQKRPSSSAQAGLRKRLRKAATQQPVDASGSTVRELCKVKDRAGVDRYFASIMTRLKCFEGEDPLVPRWSTISGSNSFWTEGPLSREYLRGALHPTLVNQSQYEKILALRVVNKELKASIGQELVAAAERQAKELEAEVERMRTELESLRSQRRELEQEVGLLHFSLDGARNDQARLEGDVLSLTEATALLEAELKAKGQRAVAAYKKSRGFESGLEKMGRVSYEFKYRVVFERLRGKHPNIMIELDPFVECPEDANVEMDLDQPFDNGAPLEKQSAP
ncbi:hypothetical protein BHM03_00014891 [Ensete ventricosum]|nr:hypothetical protein BHM03_00014891 [Ensete ventricosum]